MPGVGLLSKFLARAFFFILTERAAEGLAASLPASLQRCPSCGSSLVLRAISFEEVLICCASDACLFPLEEQDAADAYTVRVDDPDYGACVERWGGGDAPALARVGHLLQEAALFAAPGGGLDDREPAAAGPPAAQPLFAASPALFPAAGPAQPPSTDSGTATPLPQWDLGSPANFPAARRRQDSSGGSSCGSSTGASPMRLGFGAAGSACSSGRLPTPGGFGHSAGSATSGSSSGRFPTPSRGGSGDGLAALEPLPPAATGADPEAPVASADGSAAAAAALPAAGSSAAGAATAHGSLDLARAGSGAQSPPLLDMMLRPPASSAELRPCD